MSKLEFIYFNIVRISDIHRHDWVHLVSNESNSYEYDLECVLPAECFTFHSGLWSPERCCHQCKSFSTSTVTVSDTQSAL